MQGDGEGRVIGNIEQWLCAFCRRAIGSYALWDERRICTGCIVRGLSVKVRR